MTEASSVITRNWEYWPAKTNEKTAIFKYEVKTGGSLDNKDARIFAEVVLLRQFENQDTALSFGYTLVKTDKKGDKNELSKKTFHQCYLRQSQI